MPAMRRHVIAAVALGAASFHLYAAGFSPFTALVQRPVHLALMATLGFLGVGVRAATQEGTSRHVSRLASTVDTTLIVVLASACAYLVWANEELVRRIGTATTLDLVLGGLTIVAVLELARRTTGWGLVSVAVAALVYGLAGPYLPGILAHRGYGVARIIQQLYLSTEGIWGIPLAVSANFVYLFVLFGALLDGAGGGQLLITLAAGVAGGRHDRAKSLARSTECPEGAVGVLLPDDRPAKTAALASALMGSLSGSAVANVVTTGSLTIPLMKRAGFEPRQAAAIEAAASTGGQLMPPIMGAGAFILATWTNIPYLRVATAAVVPALLYYAALLLGIHFSARRQQRAANASSARHDQAELNQPSSSSEPQLAEIEEGPQPSIRSRLHLLLPLVAIVALLALGRSPMRAAFWGVASALALSFASRTTRPSVGKLRQIVVAAAAGSVQVAAACATAGIIVGIATLTGIGLRMSELIVTLSNGHLPVALLLTAAGSVVLGMGLPTTAAYVVLAALGAPALIELGVPMLAAHLFIFYFGCISNITPPVALAAYAAAGIAEASPLRTATAAVALASTGFVVPFMFVYGPALLLDAPPLDIVIAVISGLAGVTALAAAGSGYHNRRLPGWERAVLAAAALTLLFPDLATDVAGAVVLGASMLARTRLAFTKAADG